MKNSNKQISIKQIESIIKKIVEKFDVKKHGILCYKSCEFHKTSNKTVQVSNGKSGLIVDGLYDNYYHNDKYADVVINHFTKQCTDVIFPRLEDVFPDYTSHNTDYEKHVVTIPKFKKSSVVYIVKTETGIEFLEKAKTENIKDYSVKISPELLNLFAGLQVNLYFNSCRKRDFIVLESLTSEGIKFKYVAVPYNF